VLYAPDEEAAQRGFDAAFGAMSRVDELLSDYRPDSELSRINAAAGEWVRVSEGTLRVLRLARQVSMETGGSFDMTAGPAVALWRETRRTGVAAGAVERARAVSLVDWRAMEVVGDAARLHGRGMRLDAGGIGKGHAVSEAVKALGKLGLGRCLVSLAGDVGAGDAPPGERGWRVRVSASGDEGAGVLWLRWACVSTSGDAEQFVEIGGVRYSHVVDPRTGMGLTHGMAATVVARDGAVADAMATALCVMGPERAREFASRRRAFSAILHEPGKEPVVIDGAGLIEFAQPSTGVQAPEDAPLR
jgi:thiamine biosynthesis lipoprotein